MFLPLGLLCLSSVILTCAQSNQQLSINSVVSFTPSSEPNHPIFTIPASNTLAISVAFCSGTSQSYPRFFLTNSSTVLTPGSSNLGTSDIFEIVPKDGFGVWEGSFSAGGILTVEGLGQMSFELGVSDGAPIHDILPNVPLLGDTTSNQALVFSAPFNTSPSAQSFFPQSTYPNYTLPAANLSFPNSPSSSPNFTLILSPTSSASPLTTLHQTGCRLSAIKSAGTVLNQSLWLRDMQGWRNQWLVGGLSPLTNYTAYVVQDGTKPSHTWLTSSPPASFSCPLVYSLPFCPTISYAVPLPAPPFPFPAYDSTTVPSSLTAPILRYIGNFTTTLRSIACGRDLYSPLVSCADCQSAYRTWLCAVSFTRCSEPSPGSEISSILPQPSATGLSASEPQIGDSDTQIPISALVPQLPSAAPRNPNLPIISTSYTALLPCLETCRAVDRACPNFLGFRCPKLRFNAAASYGVGYVDEGRNGIQGHGRTGVTQDQWGNVWCNGN